ncbi:ATP-binding protein [Allonocardiopsis opalescens]|uniref:Anti-sigma regulatory factor (Ser/Thr protein kinase) n=1 Tax=Allonocardiopsis opalescens TaxID=1144618 RepID=A0A2T0PTA0_9ACTN|nr:ATP-binding protein [Allonocardiopsis opalescens]PRX92129.1 anti-sigma regulatory factor (Ser/Thr protein kinase) [Allonocardiopsis opalescens]
MSGVELMLTFPATPAAVPLARRVVGCLLRDHPRVRDAELVASELVANALRNTTDGHDVRLLVGIEGDRVRIDVRDDGTAPTDRPAAVGEQYWPGIVSLLADGFGAVRRPEVGHRVHGELVEEGWRVLPVP